MKKAAGASHQKQATDVKAAGASHQGQAADVKAAGASHQKRDCNSLSQRADLAAAVTGSR